MFSGAQFQWAANSGGELWTSSGISPEKKRCLNSHQIRLGGRKRYAGLQRFQERYQEFGFGRKQVDAGAINRIVIKAPGESKADAMRMACRGLYSDGGAYLAIKIPEQIRSG